MKVAITGATGFVGSRLVESLHSRGYQIVVLTRNPERGRRVFPASDFPQVEIVGYTPTESGDWQGAIAGCEGVVNLAGAPLADERWTPERKRVLFESRVTQTQKLVEAINSADPKPRVLVSTSAIGYYGTSETATFDESSAAGDDFLADLCQEWEAAAQGVKDTGTRLAILRFGIVLGMGGALGKMLPPFKLFAGGPLGSGRQWFSWIHRDDLTDLIRFSLENESVEGVLNATAPNPVRMNELCHQLGEILHRPSWLPVPSFALEALLGDAAQVVLEGQQVIPDRTGSYNFEYQYPTVKQALEEILA
ncbi:TIGR01777 family oxidoreductase [Lyngbya sp. CCY1209]|uniref:thylakoid membrane protein ThyD n=1 Tax=Lyngbya sp. CCY1209 TaxID=2886103 RepID=UPI002D2075ED|nr:TIGR01777 family oxidoreductase [Lyngbya sp. CCY1209]MEB3883754.1 TIGR01777 family oxidoreductase [Lyngbya sp. CCY1209]